MLICLLILKFSCFALLGIGAVSAMGFCIEPARRFFNVPLSFHDNFAWGLLLIVGICWYGVGVVDLTVILRAALIGVSIGVVTFSVFQRRRLLLTLRQGRFFSECFAILVIFLLVSVLYGYVSIAPYAESSLIVPSRGNLDIFTYVNSSAFLLNPTQTSVMHLFGIDTLSAALKVKEDAFGSFALISFLSSILDQTTLSVVVPVIFIVATLIGSAIYGFCRGILAGGRVLSLLVSVQFLMMPLFQYILLNFFIGQLLSSWALLRVIQIVLDEKVVSEFSKLSFRLFPYVGIMFMTYLSTLPTNIMLAVGMFLARYFLVGGMRKLLPGIRQALGSIIIVGLGLAGCFPYRIEVFERMLRLLSEIDAGWSLQYVSPFSLLGINASPGIIFARSELLVLISVVLFSIVLFRIFRTLIQKSSWCDLKVQLFILYSLLWILYNCAFLYYGADSYRQWKFATFYPMMFSFVISYIFFERILAGAWRGNRYAVGFFLILGLMVPATMYSQSTAMTFRLSKNLENLRQLNNFVEIENIIVDKIDTAESMVLPNLIQNKRLWFTGYSLPLPTEDLSLETVREKSAAFLTKTVKIYNSGDLVVELDNGYLLLRNPEKYMSKDFLIEHFQ